MSPRYTHTAIRTFNRELVIGNTYLYIEHYLRVKVLLHADNTNDEFLVFVLRPLRSNRPTLRDDFTVTISRSMPTYGGLWQIHEMADGEI